MRIKLFIISLIIFLAIDSLWLTTIASNFYQENLGFILTDNPNLLAAGIFYLLFIFGLTFFVTEPAIKSKSLNKAILLGGLFGLITYATYDLTNLATIENWPLIVTVVDMLWGTALGATVSFSTFLIVNRLKLVK